MLALLAGLVAIAVVRLFDVSARPLLVAVAGVAPLLLFPVYLVLGYAAGDRRPLMGGVALALVVCQIVWLRADYATTPAYAGCAGTAAACVDLTVASGNLYKANRDPIAGFEALVATNPDVIVVQEAAEWDRIVASGAADAYEHRFTDPATLGVAVVSKLPILEVTLTETPGRRLPLVVIDSTSGPIALLAVHFAPPLSRAQIELWGDQSRATAELAAELDGPLIVVGDFNATGQHEEMGRILDTGLRDAHLERGDGLGATWPVGRVVPPVLRIDHLLVSDHFDVAVFDVVTIPGSDHRGIVAGLVLSEAARSTAGRGA